MRFAPCGSLPVNAWNELDQGEIWLEVDPGYRAGINVGRLLALLFVRCVSGDSLLEVVVERN